MSDSFETPWTVARQNPLSLRFPRARILVWIATAFSSLSSWPREQTCVSCISGWILYHLATWDPYLYLLGHFILLKKSCVSVHQQSSTGKRNSSFGKTWLSLEGIMLGEKKHRDIQALYGMINLWNKTKYHSHINQIAWWLPGAG